MDLGGEVPRTVDLLKTLPGVGRYTASQPSLILMVTVSLPVFSPTHRCSSLHCIWRGKYQLSSELFALEEVQELPLFDGTSVEIHFSVLYTNFTARSNTVHCRLSCMVCPSEMWCCGRERCPGILPSSSHRSRHIQ